MKVFLTPLHWPREGPVLQEMLGAWKNSRSFRLLTDLHSHPHLRNFSTSDEMTAGSSREETLLPPEVLFIAGAGHIGRAMVPLAETLEFEIGIFDERNEELHLVPDIPIISKFSTPEALHHWFTPRACRAWVVLVTRGFRSDLAVLEAIKENIPKVRYLGILGSQRRISLLKTEWAAQGGAPFPGDKTHAPVGLSIGAETPAEIAISIFAEIIASRTKRKPG